MLRGKRPTCTCQPISLSSSSTHVDLLFFFFFVTLLSQDYFWASTIVTSRSFPSTLLANTSHASGPPGDHDANQPTLRASETVPILLPGVDIFNHKRGSKIEWRSVRNQPDTHRIEIVSLEEQIPKG
jgi:hypothetical protein